MALENTTGKRGFVSVCFSPLATVVHSIQQCIGQQCVLLNGTSTMARSSGTSEGSSPANSMKQHSPMDSFPSTQKAASWQSQLAIYLRRHHPMGHGHGYTLSIGGEEYLFQIWSFSWCSDSALEIVASP